MSETVERRRRLDLALAMLLLAVGCAPPPATEGPQGKSLSPGVSAEDAAPAGGLAEHPLAGETWEVLYIGGAKVGYSQAATAPAPSEGRTVFCITSYSEMQLKRFGQSVAQQLRLASWETADGRLVRFETRIASGPAAVATKGRVQDDTLKLETTTQGKTQNAAIPWQGSWGGFFAAEYSLRRQPMRPGESRGLRALIPVFNQVGEIRLDAVGYETTRLLNGSQRLLKINSVVKLGGQTIDSVLWVDAAGETIKAFVPGLGQTSYRATREAALETAGLGQYDLGEASVVKADRRLAHPHDTQRIVYRAVVEHGDPRTVFVSCPTQRVRLIDEKTVEVEVLSDRLVAAGKLAGEESEPPSGDDLAPNNLIQSDDARVDVLARKAAPGEKDPWRIAVSLEKLVHQSVRQRDFSYAFATAAEVAQTLQGDCTEHAVLLAALCRARGVPARVAMGLVYYSSQGGFAYHMWNEVWAEGRWRPLDATLGRGGIGAAHLKLAHSNLQGVDAYKALLPVFQVLGRLQLQILEVDESSPQPDAARNNKTSPDTGSAAP